MKIEDTFNTLPYKCYIAQTLYKSDAKDLGYINKEKLSLEESGFDVLIETLPEITRFWVRPYNLNAMKIMQDHNYGMLGNITL